MKTEPDSDETIVSILHPLVKEWFFRRYKGFSLPQSYAVLDIHSRRNVLVSAPTGGTKTLTAFLSVLNELIDSSMKGILEDRTYCIYISPLKALGYDIEVNLKRPLAEMEEIHGEKLGIRIGTRTGDTTPKERSAMTRKPPHILITTPESLAIILTSLRFRDHIRRVDWMIVDEIHALADSKRGVHLSLTLERLQRLSPGMARIGLSATIAPIGQIADFLVGNDGEKQRDCVIADVPMAKKLDLQVLSPVKDMIRSSHQEKQRAMYDLMHQLIQQHKTTLVFTNTRAATERVVMILKERFPRDYGENIGAHHGSLSKEHRHSLEERLRQGRLKAVVSSTSLELGIDIGYIDLVILLGSPKSVARALQRIGRSGHRLHEVTKGRIIVLDRDDLVECSVLLKDAVERKVDRISMPENCLDVLAQHIYGIAIEGQVHIDDLFSLVRGSHPYRSLERRDFQSVIDYLAGRHLLEKRHVYAKIWHDETTGMIGRKGKLARVLYMTNIGTIPDEAFITVKVGNQSIGKIDEAFLERLRRGDVFVLGGDKYEFLFARGTVAQVNASVYRPPSIPSWVSEMLPLSYDLALDIGRFRRLLSEKLAKRGEGRKFIGSYLYVDENAAQSILGYIQEQNLYAKIATDRKIVVEHYKSGERDMYIFHAMFGRRVNDALSRAFAYAASRLHLKDIEIYVNDNGFAIASRIRINVTEVIKIMKASDLDELLKLAIEKTEVLRRRFRHCATRGLMILRSYKGRTKLVGRQQVSSTLLLNAIQSIPDFPLLKEARREVLDDLMDRQNAKKVVLAVKEGTIAIEHITTMIPSPFAFNLVLQGELDILKMEDREDFLKRMHQMVIAKIALKDKDRKAEFSYEALWDAEDEDSNTLKRRSEPRS